MNPTSPLPPPLAGESFSLVDAGAPVACYGSAPTVGQGPPLVLVHSVNAAATAYEVKPLFDHYATRRPVYALDLPGYGRSDRSDRVYSLRLMTDAVAALVAEVSRRHGGGPVDAIGVSLSAEYVARAAAERPQDFRTVCLVSATGLNRIAPRDGPPGSTRGQAWLLKALGQAPWSPALFRLLTRPGVIRFFLQKTWGSKDIDEELLAYDVLTARQPGAHHVPFYFLSAFLFSADITRVYESLAMPTLLVHGTRGDFVDYRGADRLVRDHGWHRHVMQTGALPYFEDLDGFVRAYETFVAASGAAGARLKTSIAS